MYKYAFFTKITNIAKGDASDYELDPLQRESLQLIMSVIADGVSELVGSNELGCYSNDVSYTLGQFTGD